MQITWEGYYLDGRTAARLHVAIHLTPDSLRMTTDNGTTLSWPYGEIRQTQGFYAGEQVRLERGHDRPEILVVSEAAFLSALHRIAPRRTWHFHNPLRRPLRVRLTVLAVALSVGALTTVYLWGIPALVAFAVPHVPIAWEERLGEAIITHLAPPEKRCTDPAHTKVIDDIMTTLTAPLSQSPYTFRVIVVDSPVVNALAAPGGYIVLFRGLLEQTGSAEELAAVLAHEVQHVLHRHATHAVLQHASTGVLATVLIGDVSGVVTFGLEIARMFALLQYSRRNEEEADREGVRMLLAAGIDPAGMTTFFASLKKEEEGTPAVPSYFSTHPRTDDRLARLKELATQPQPNPVKLLPHYVWRDIRKICQAAP